MADVSDPQRDFYTRLMSQYRGRTLKKGDRSKTTRALQLFLREQGYDIKADGAFGPRTEAALRAYQKANGLSADGQAGKRTLTKIREGITPTPTARPVAVPRGDFTSPIAGPKPVVPRPVRTMTSSGMPGGDPGLGIVRPPPPVTDPMAGISNIPAGLGGARPVPRARPSFEPAAVSRSVGSPTAGMPLPRPPMPPPMPPPAPVAGVGAPPGGSQVLPTGPLPRPPVGPSPDEPEAVDNPAEEVAESSSPTVPSDLNPAQLGRVREAQGIGPFPPRPGVMPPSSPLPTGLSKALALGGGPTNQLLFPEPPAPGGQLPVTEEMTPETIAMIQALLQGRTGMPPTGQAGM